MKEKYFDWIKILAGVGIFLALYLIWQQLFHPAFQPCNVNAVVNCDATVNGPLAKTFGVSTPLIGLVGYIVILFSAIKKSLKWVLGMAAFGLTFCLYIAYREVFELHVICPVCVLCQLDMITVFVLGILLQKKKTPAT